jgi:hypothetical protein
MDFLPTDTHLLEFWLKSFIQIHIYVYSHILSIKEKKNIVGGTRRVGNKKKVKGSDPSIFVYIYLMLCLYLYVDTDIDMFLNL